MDPYNSQAIVHTHLNKTAASGMELGHWWAKFDVSYRYKNNTELIAYPDQIQQIKYLMGK